MTDIIRLSSIYNSPTTYFKELDITVLLDTGATMPVWTSMADINTYFKDAQPMNSLCILRGFDGKTFEGEVYKIPRFVMGERKRLIFLDMPIVIVHNQYTRYDMVLSNTIFGKYKVAFDNERRLCAIDTHDREINCIAVGRR